MLGRDYPELRRAYLRFPWTRFYEHPRTIATLCEMIRAAIGACRPQERTAFAYALVPRYRKHRGHPIALSPALAAAITKDLSADDLSLAWTLLVR